jgi:hypothetical protein
VKSSDPKALNNNASLRSRQTVTGQAKHSKLSAIVNASAAPNKRF